VEKEMAKNFGNGHLFLSKKMSGQKVSNDEIYENRFYTIIVTNPELFFKVTA